MKLTVGPYDVAFYSWIFTQENENICPHEDLCGMFTADLSVIAKNWGKRTNIHKQKCKRIIVHLYIETTQQEKQITKSHNNVNKYYEYYADKRM